MNATKRRVSVLALKLFDLGLVTLAFFLATLPVAYASEHISIAGFLGMRVKLGNILIYAAMLAACHIIFTVSGLYESDRFATRRNEIVVCLNATLLATSCVLLCCYLYSIQMITPRFLLWFFTLSSVLIVSTRMFLREMLMYARKGGHNLRFVLILGTNSRAISFARRLQAKPELGYRTVGFVDEDWHGMAEFKRSGYALACDYDGLAEFLRHNVVDEVAIYLPFRSYFMHSSQVAMLCETHGILSRFDPDIFGLKTARSHAEEFDGGHHIAAYTGVRAEGPLMIKRVIDIVASLALLTLLAPLFALVAILIKLNSKGPVMFMQERVGLNKRRFRIFKFRTMVMDAEQLMAKLEEQNEVSGPVFKMKNDPRITAMGKFLRRTSIDELPQILNVLKGDMSLVGPRPLPVRDYNGFNEDWQRRRFSVRPGITCLWQVNGRSTIGFEDWMKLDIQYMDEWSLWLDFKILARTIPAVLKGSGAV
jgi:exopolysaccharide biosynthesis polyprenyl glycosylphosphotransferase